MSLETQVQNLVAETKRRWKSIRAKGDRPTHSDARDVLTKLAFGAWLLAGNLLRAAAGSRVHRLSLPIRKFQGRLQQTDEAHLLALLDHAVAAVLWHLIIARRDGVGLRRIEHLVADFVDTSEEDLVKLHRLAESFNHAH